MKLFETPWLSREQDNDEFTYGYNRLTVCSSGLVDFFHVPREARKVKFIAHDRPAADRVEVTPCSTSPDCNFDGTYMYLTNGMRQIAKRLIRESRKSKFYAEVFYE